MQKCPTIRGSGCSGQCQRGRRPRHGSISAPATLPPDAGHRYRLTAGRTGPWVAELAFQHGGAGSAGWPSPDVWLVGRRAVGEQPALKGYLSHAPAHLPVTRLVRVAGRRWPIDTACEESPGGLDLDHDEGRSWLGWPHPLTLCLLAHHGLGRARRRVNQGRPRSPLGRRCDGWPRSCPRSRSRLNRRWREAGLSRPSITRLIAPIAGTSWRVWMACAEVTV
jgi:hypothetical protein